MSRPAIAAKMMPVFILLDQAKILANAHMVFPRKTNVRVPTGAAVSVASAFDPLWQKAGE